MKKNQYTVTVSSSLATSATKTFIISSKRVRISLIASSLLLVIFGFIIFDYLTISFEKEKIKILQSRIIELENNTSLKTERSNLQKKLESMTNDKEDLNFF